MKNIIEKYPKIFQPYVGNPGNVNWEVPEGWYQIIDDMCYLIQSYCDDKESILNPDYDDSLLYLKDDTKTHNYLLVPRNQITCSQIKEKFGGLRFYANNETPYTNGIVDYAEYLCYKTCVYCSSIKDIKMTKGWILPVCPDCIIQHNLKV